MHPQGPEPERGRSEVEVQVRRLRMAVIALGVAWMGTVGWAALATPSIPRVLEVERLDIVEPGGELAIVLANTQRRVGGRMDGQIVLVESEEERRGIPGIQFFDGRGDEVGGLSFGVRDTDDGFYASRHFAFDAYKQDQSVFVHHYQSPAGARAGLTVVDRPERSMLEFWDELGLEPPFSREELSTAMVSIPEERRAVLEEDFASAARVFVGSDEDNNAMLALMDPRGRPRIVLNVSPDGEPSIRVLDQEGQALWELPAP